MNKFWEWMIYNHYAVHQDDEADEDYYKYSLLDEEDTRVCPGKIMLIGHMLAYLKEEHKVSSFEFIDIGIEAIYTLLSREIQKRNIL